VHAEDMTVGVNGATTVCLPRCLQRVAFPKQDASGVDFR